VLAAIVQAYFNLKNQMGNPYHYLFYFTQYNVNKIRPLNARESAILYVSAIVFFLTMPCIAKGIVEVIGKGQRGIFYAVLLGYGFLIYYLNKSYFEKKKVYIQVAEKYKKQSSAQIAVGRTIAWLSLAASFFLFFWVLREL
jgi:hypothetical protein